MTYKATLARIKAGIVRNYQDAPELTSTFLSLCAACFLGAILTGFWSLWAAFIVSGAGFAYAGYCNAPTGDEYGADGL
jgi:fatty acid desaturase